MKLILTLSVLVAAVMAEQDPKQLDNLLREGNNQFTARMFSEVVKSNPDKSVVLSAFSVLTPLAQLSLASEGASHDELLKAIGLPNDNVTKLVFPRLNEELKSVKGVELKTASKIYVADGSELNPEFSAITKDIFNSEVKNVDFTKSTETAKEINTWVEDQTNNRIKDLVSADDLSSDTRSVLVNAIYFKGKWDSPFKKESTKDEDFHVSKDKTIKVPMMHVQGDFKYADSDELNAQLLEMPYEGGEASFIVILPKEVDGIAALVDKLKDPSALESATSKMYTFDVNVSLPKFKIETKTDLKDVLLKMDVKRVFDPQQAQLSRLLKGEGNLFVSKAIQKAFIEVNEEGAEAAAANAFGIATLSAVIRQQTKFTADRPFVFFLKEGDNTFFNGIYRS
ncbi:antichymotrypsin-2-like isoform X4 [Hyposmocoma kahamanoa]|uniref:antichymotrypsin-2-like isoform X4 n=1 Tax=Hyposmocoma kahamanoa TaxID=1477025 RepID=UPI000E6D713B|nr:antichymotrypsin-2-like isoform X4 [Hyposmocoma kahamanoa]XP_026328450.1 antichymotrypsin-2-like isoform X4 [Hyposmocoma kahamanoa]